LEYKDYYKILEVDRGADKAAIQKAYKKLARKYHPDVSKVKGAEDRFKDLSEAYDVLKDPKKRKQYDQFGSHWQQAAQSGHPSAEDVFSQFRSSAGGGGPSGFSTNFQSEGGFSDFFNMLFNERRGQKSGARPGRRHTFQSKGDDQEVELAIPLEDAYRGATRKITLKMTDHVGGRPQQTTKNFEVMIPAGVTTGAKIRLSGQGSPGVGGGSAGDIFLVIKIQEDPTYSVDGSELTLVVGITPWEAALGGKVQVPTLEGPINLKIPPGTQTDQRFRVRGRGLNARDGGRADQFVRVRIQVPKTLTDEERTLFERLQEVSRFDPRG